MKRMKLHESLHLNFLIGFAGIISYNYSECYAANFSTYITYGTKLKNISTIADYDYLCCLVPVDFLKLFAEHLNLFDLQAHAGIILSV